MSDPTGVQHPYADFGGDGFAATETRASVVHLSPGRINLLHQSTADGNRAILVTDELCRLTPAFGDVWREAGAGWVVRSANGLREGFTGKALETVGDVFSPDPIETIDDLDLRFLNTPVADTIEWIIHLNQRHRPNSNTVLGGAVERLGTLITGQPPQHWGPYEPAGEAWDPDRLTAFVRGQMPGPILVKAGGPGQSIVITAQRTPEGVEETTRVHASLGAVDEQTVESLTAAISTYLSELAETAMPLVAFVMIRPGFSDLLIRPFMPLPPEPRLLLIGAPAVRHLDLDLTQLSQSVGAIKIGRPRIPAVLFPLTARTPRSPELTESTEEGGPTGSTMESNGWLQLNAIVEHFDRDKLNELLGLPESYLPAEAPNGQ